MAIAIPLIMTAAGASTTAILATSLVLGATGINSKIDNAASKVFGKDLVKVGNIAGSAFMAFGGSFGSSASVGLSAAEDAGSAFAVNGADAMDNIAAAANPSSAAYVNPMDAASDAASRGTGALKKVGGNGITAANSQVAPTQGGTPSMIDRATGAWKSLGDKGQGALLQVGGNLLSGIAQGSAQQKQMEDERAWQEKYRSGSGLKTWAPGQNAYTPKPGG